jgi:aspartate aminotransferase
VSTAQETEEALARPLERFADLHAAALRVRGVIDLSYPNPLTWRDPRAFELLGTVSARASQRDLQYTPFGGNMIVRRRVATALSARFGVRLGAADIVLTPGATAALNVAFAALFHSGDEVLVVTPCWMDYHLYLARLGVRVIGVPAGPGKRLDVAALAAAWSPAAAGVIISQPSCPAGVVYGEQELTALADLLRDAPAREGRSPVLVSDEVHRDQVWDGTLISPMQIWPETVSVYSFGKAWALQGQRTGYLALGPGLAARPGMAARVSRAVRAMGFCAPTALMQRLLLEIVDLVPDSGSLRRDQQALRALLASQGHEVIPAQATSFVYVRCPSGTDDWQFVTRLAGCGVLAMPSELFHECGHYRLAINVPAEQFPEIARRLAAVVTPAALGGPANLR